MQSSAIWEPHLLGGATGESCEVPERLSRTTLRWGLAEPEALPGRGGVLLRGETGTPAVTPAITNPGNLAPHSGNWFKRKIAEGSCQVLF